MMSALASPLAPAAEAPPVPRLERLLIVEDDGFSQQLIDLYLRRAGFSDLTAAHDGRAALDLAKTERFDLVLLDLNLPRVSGVDVLRRLKRDGLLTDTPVIVISSMTNMDEIVQCLDLGADGYLPKPFNVRLLDERVSACLELRRLKREALAQIDRRQQDQQAIKALHTLLQAAPEGGDPARLGVDSACLSLPAPQGGGDLSLITRTSSGLLWAALGSVAATGAAAPLAAAYGLLHLRSLLDQETAPDAVLTRLNRQLSQSANGWTCPPIALTLLALTPETGAFTLASAGGLDPLLIDLHRGLMPLPVDRGRPLARRADAVYSAFPGVLSPDTALVLTSAGVADAQDAGGMSFGDQRLKRCLSDAETSDPRALAAAARTALTHFTGPTPLPDDASLLVLRRLSPSV